MKKNIIIFFTLLFFLTFGCKKLPLGNNFLEKAPGVDVTKDTIFSNITYAERFLTGAYFTLPYGLNAYVNGIIPEQNPNKETKMYEDLLESITDLCQSYCSWCGTNQTYYNGVYTAASENGANTKYHLTYEGSYDGIRRCCIFLENIDRVPNVDLTYRKQLKAEARMIMAVHYCDMYRNFGSIPWINHAYTVNEKIDTITRPTARETCDSIIALCDKAAPDLPWALSDVSLQDGRFTKASAMALKVRVLLFDASPLFNSNTPYMDGVAAEKKLVWHGGYDPNLWKKAADAAHNLITQVEATGDYKMYHKIGNSFRQDFQDAYYTRGNGEILISTRIVFRSRWDDIFYRSATQWGCGGCTDEEVKFFPMANGKPITDPTSGYDSTNPYINRDPRLYETVLVNGDTYMGRTAELWIGGQERLSTSATAGCTGYNLRKFALDFTSNTSVGAIVQWPYLRLPEIYLSYAEADNEFYGAPSPEDYRCVNIVRNRVGLGNLPTGLTKEQFREAILIERANEFGWEEIRWYDIARWKRDDIFKKPLHGMDIRRFGTGPYTYTYRPFLCPQRYWAKNFSPKWYLSAFPLAEMQKGYGLIQNPGWE
jgi:hypothetical protein